MPPSEAAMFSVILRLLLLLAASITSWLVAKDAPHFNAVQTAVAIVLLALFVIALGVWLADEMLHRA